MEKDQSHMTGNILHLTLEIIYLLTGEDYELVKKKTNEKLTPSGCPHKSSLPTFMIPEEDRKQKILEVTQKIIELLTGEVPIRCQDVTSNVSTEEWEYLEGRKDLYKDIVMKDQPPPTSPGDFSNRNPPDICPHSIYSQDSTQEGHTIPQNDQGKEPKGIKIEVKEEEEEMLIWDDHSTDNMVPIKEEESSHVPIAEQPPITSPDPSSKRNTVKRYQQPLHLQDRTQKEHSYARHVQIDEGVYMKVKVKEEEEEMLVSREQQSLKEGKMVVTFKDEESSPDINTDEHGGQHKDLSLTSPMVRCSPNNTFLCPTWDECFTSQQNLDINQREHTEGLSLSFPEFKECFTFKPDPPLHQGVQREELIVHDSKPTFPCSECGKCFKLRNRLFRHDQRCHGGIQTLAYGGERPYACSECDKRFARKCDLNTHQRAHILKQSCSQCDKSFFTKKELDKHQRTHPSVETFSCSQCGKCFGKKRDLHIHQKIHQENWSCSDCNKTFISKARLIRHQIVHTGQKPFTCCECEKCFFFKANLRIHMKIHTHERRFSCAKCGKCFLYKKDLLVHQSTHLGKPPYPCPECGESFDSKTEFAVHRRSHTGAKTVSCSECNRSFLHKSELVIHQRLHTGERPFLCSECGKVFSHKGSLKAHLKTHTGETLLPCPECGKQVRGEQSLLIHRRSHTGERPFSCPECGKSFKAQYHLTVHKKIHIGEKRLPCVDCGKLFLRKSNLLSHQKIHSSKKPFSCSMCR